MYKILASTLFLGKEVIYMPSCHSTNDIAQELVRKYDKSEGTIVITDEQTKGRGQRGNNWDTEAGKNLTFSLILKPRFLNATKQFYLNMAVSLAIAESVETQLKSDQIQIKWPNDLLINKHKVCGILIENSLAGSVIGSSVVGVGLNVNQENFALPFATSLRQVSGEQYELTAYLEKLVLLLEKYYLILKAGDFTSLKEQYFARLYGYKSAIKLKCEYEFVGQIIDLDEYGRLVVEEKDSRHVFDFKEVRFILTE